MMGMNLGCDKIWLLYNTNSIFVIQLKIISFASSLSTGCIL